MHESVIAFIMDCDFRNLTYEEGIDRAQQIGDELIAAAEDRILYARKEHDESR